MSGTFGLQKIFWNLKGCAHVWFFWGVYWHPNFQSQGQESQRSVVEERRRRSSTFLQICQRLNPATRITLQPCKGIDITLPLVLMQKFAVRLMNECKSFLCWAKWTHYWNASMEKSGSNRSCAYSDLFFNDYFLNNLVRKNCPYFSVKTHSVNEL